MTQNKNIGFEFLRVARENPDHVALAFEGQDITYANLQRVVEAFAVRLQEHGVDQESMLVLDVPDILAAVSLPFSVALLGASFTFANKYLAKTNVVVPTHFFATNEGKDIQKIRRVVIDGSWSPHIVLKNRDSINNYEGYKSENDPWMITNTSGSTGLPKFLEISYQMIFDRSIATPTEFVFRKTRFVSLFSCTAFPFLSRAMAALLNTCTIVDSKDMEFWQKSLVNMVVASPHQVKELLSGVMLESKIPEIHTGGGKLGDEMVRELLNNFEVVVDAYGASETNRSFKNFKTLNGDGSIKTSGQKLDSEIEILDEDGAYCDIGEIGVVRVRNPYLVKRYLNNPEAGKIAFRDGWFYPGDRGSWGWNGELIIDGRVDSVINLGGIKINAILVENVLRAVEGIEDAIVFRDPRKNAAPRILSFVVFEPLTLRAECIVGARNLCIQNVQIAAVPHEFFAIDMIPLNTNGKPDRSACAAILLRVIDSENGSKPA